MTAQELTADIIYLMGGSFVMGSLFTILLLLVLELVRSRGEQQDEEPPHE